MTLSRFLAPALFACVAVVAVVTSGGRAAGGEGERGQLYQAAKVATVDMQDVISSHLQKTGAQASMDESFVSRRKALDEMATMIQEMEQESQVYPRDSQKYLEIAAKVAVKRNELRVQREALNEGREMEAGKLTRETYAKARKIIESVARSKDLDMVVMINRDAVGGASMGEVSSGIVTRTVLYAKNELDITEEVKSMMSR